MATATAPAFFTQQDEDYILAFGDIEVNLDRNTITRSGKQVRLTQSEQELLMHFLTNPGRELSRDSILDAVWSYLPSPNTRTVDAHVLRLRQKLEDDPNNPRYFLTLHRVGYRFDATPVRL
jgi:DNA-binding response OmpR family regulator